jgi:hypothetical protein
MSPRVCRLKMARNYHKIEMLPGSSTGEHSAVNRNVRGSNPPRGAKTHLTSLNYGVRVEPSARQRTLEHSKRKSRMKVVDGTAHFRHACNAKMRRHKNVVVHSDLGTTKTLLTVA